MNLQVSSFLAATWGAGANDVYAVGDGGLLVHYDGSSWTKVPTGSTESFLSIWGDLSRKVERAVAADGPARAHRDLGQVGHRDQQRLRRR